MTWENPPTIITLLRAELQGSATWLSIGGLEANIHFPDAPLPGEDGGYPMAVLSRTSSNMPTFATGAPPLRNGSLMITLHAPAENFDVGDLEEYAEAIASEMVTDPTIINLQITDIDQASYPDEPTTAEADTATSQNVTLSSITITFSYGITA